MRDRGHTKQSLVLRCGRPVAAQQVRHLPPRPQAAEEHQHPGEQQRRERIGDELRGARVLEGGKQGGPVPKKVVGRDQERFQQGDLFLGVASQGIVWVRQGSAAGMGHRLGTSHHRVRAYYTADLAQCEKNRS